MRLSLLLVPVLAAVSALGCRAADSITLTLENVGRIPLDSVTIFTTGRSYPIGSIPAGASSRLMIGANGESHIEIEHGGHPRRRLRVGTYFENGYSGEINVRLTADSVVAVVDSIKISVRRGGRGTAKTWQPPVPLTSYFSPLTFLSHST